MHTVFMHKHNPLLVIRYSLYMNWLFRLSIIVKYSMFLSEINKQKPIQPNISTIYKTFLSIMTLISKWFEKGFIKVIQHDDTIEISQSKYIFDVHIGNVNTVSLCHNDVFIEPF